MKGNDEIVARCMILEGRHVLYDTAYTSLLSEPLFEPVQLEHSGLIIGRAKGRGDAWFIQLDQSCVVLRHFRRGGLIGRCVSDRYLYLGLERNRAWKEWYLLAELYQRDLPVPRPVAAAVTVNGLSYCADIVTEMIPGSSSLAEVLSRQKLSSDVWIRLGACVRRFHDQGADHPDLNARNILLDHQTDIYLIDFDRGSLRKPGVWSKKNLLRLKRSLVKIKSHATPFYFDEEEWALLLSGYLKKSEIF